MRKNSAHSLPVSKWMKDVIRDLPNLGCPVLYEGALRPLTIDINYAETQVVVGETLGIAVLLVFTATSTRSKVQIVDWDISLLVDWDISLPELGIDCALVPIPENWDSLHLPFCATVSPSQVFNERDLKLAERSSRTVKLFASALQKIPEIRDRQKVAVRLVGYDIDSSYAWTFPITGELRKSKLLLRPSSTLLEPADSIQCRRLLPAHVTQDGMAVPKGPSAVGVPNKQGISQQVSRDGEEMRIKH